MLDDLSRDDFRARLKAAGLTVQMLADLAHVPRSAIDNYLYGKTAEIKTVEYVRAIDDVLAHYTAVATQHRNDDVTVNINMLIAEIEARHAAEMDALRQHYEERICHIRSDHTAQMDSVRRDSRWRLRAFLFMLIVYVGQWIYDIINLKVGFIRGAIPLVSEFFTSMFG